MQAPTLFEDAIAESFLLTPMQHGMVLHGLRAAREGVYVQQLVCTLDEAVKVSFLRAAWQDLVDRHAVLRTCFHLDDRDEPDQEVRQNITWELEESDWRHFGLEAGEQRLEVYLGDDRRRSFGLEHPPLWRLHLFRLADLDYRLVWTSHHALLDGRSRLILLRELFALYDACGEGKTLSLEPPRSFGDHVRWLTTRDCLGSQSYWRDLLRGFASATPLPDCNSRAVLDDEPGHRTVEFRLTEECTRALEDVALQCSVTLNTILQGAWALLLSLYSGSDDVVFGVTRACRRTSVSGAESMVGLFINTLPFRVRIRGSASLSDWLCELRSQWIAVRDHEHTPLAEVHGWSEVPASSPLFESILVFEKLRLEERLRSQGKAWVHRKIRLLGITNYPLVVAGYAGTSLLIELTYDRRRFADLAIDRIQNRLQTILERIAAGPRQTLAELPMLSVSEEHQLALDWNATATVIPREASIPLLFEAQAARTPGAVALVFGDRQWTYEELNVRANRLAHRLREMGVGFETPVAICAERSPEMVAGILAILKAGGAYVPLDPTYPYERLRSIVRDTRAPVLLTQQCLLSEVPADGMQVVCLDSDLGAFESCGDTNPSSLATFDSLAYIMFTSGSTGTPKGVAVPHRGVIRLLFGVDYVQLDSSRTMLHLASPAFDAATFELWGALLHGARCVLFPGRVPALDVLERTLRVHNVDTVFLTAALFHAVVDECVGILRGVKQLLVGGDALSVDHVRRALPGLPETTVINGYGPTETTTFAVCYRVPRTIAADASSIPIGTPIGNTTVYLLETKSTHCLLLSSSKIHRQG
jgi:amino acid adenylation domain-containing protein